jgi:hypothetical protein
MIVTGYITRKTEAAVQFVRESDARTNGVRPLWVPVSKLTGPVREADAMGRTIRTAQDGERIGIPATLSIDDDFLRKVKWVQ